MAELNDTTAFRGEVNAYVFDGEIDQTQIPAILNDRSRPEWQRLAAEYHFDNLVVNVGRQQMTKLIVLATTTPLGYIGLTTSATTPSAALAALTDEIKRNPVSVREAFSAYVQRYIAYFTAGDFNSTGIAGAGAFDAVSTGGNMYAAASIALSKSGSQGAVIDWRVTATTG